MKKTKIALLVPAIPKGFVPKKHTYTIKEAAAYIGVAVISVRRVLKDRPGLLRCSKAFSKILIMGEDVETFIARTSS